MGDAEVIQIPGAHEYLVQQMTWEAEDVLSVVLVRPDGCQVPEWTYGAHIDLVARPDLIRQYSLCSDPTDRTHWTIAVLREPNSSGGSQFVHEGLRPGMTVLVGGPRNNFPLIDAEHYLFVAGGIGVTPLLPMVLAVYNRNRDWRMLYGGRHRASMAFRDRLGALSSRVVVAPEDELGLLDLCGAVESMPAETAIYCCGPEPLIAALEAQCALSGRPGPHVERFNARPELVAAKQGFSNTAFDVVLAKSYRRFTVPADQSIVEVLSAEHVFVVTSCTEGYCGVCETEVLEGIPDHRDDYLSPEARARSKRIMVCCSRSKTPELVLNI
jgi:ferredoxin-NADP reductase